MAEQQHLIADRVSPSKFFIHFLLYLLSSSYVVLLFLYILYFSTTITTTKREDKCFRRLKLNHCDINIFDFGIILFYLSKYNCGCCWLLVPVSKHDSIYIHVNVSSVLSRLAYFMCSHQLYTKKKKSNSNVVQNILKRTTIKTVLISRCKQLNSDINASFIIIAPFVFCILWLFLDWFCFVLLCFVSFYFFFVMGHAVQVDIWIDMKPKQKQIKKKERTEINFSNKMSLLKCWWTMFLNNEYNNHHTIQFYSPNWLIIPHPRKEICMGNSNNTRILYLFTELENIIEIHKPWLFTVRYLAKSAATDIFGLFRFKSESKCKKKISYSESIMLNSKTFQNFV